LAYFIITPTRPPIPITKPPIPHPIGLTKGNPEAIAIYEVVNAPNTPNPDVLYTLLINELRPALEIKEEAADP